MGLIACPFSFNEYKRIWNSGGLNEDHESVANLIGNNPLMHETLIMQGHALAVMDVKTMRYPLILGDVEKVCGWSTEYFYEAGVEGYISKCPDRDFLGLEETSKLINSYVATLNKKQVKQFRVIYDYQMKGKDGRIRRICEESIALKTNNEGHITYFMAYVSDITHFKRAGKQHMHLTGGNTSRFFEINNETNTVAELTLLTKREQEIAKLLGEGFNSYEIAEKLFISVNTVNTHRQNMLKKFNLVDATELMNLLRIYRMI
ncbi:LuxR C-terminal-related transcriptional regulator [Emticicia sp. BO119]|uniref:helix-turn-helix transcriptional regulator n=1 Tax=Emticicia sp. BO119 TaxID=2757768 RepID=UPI001804D305|nr:LuxR C-terminal-related transcriptional regulator [Emticicia sp. BO119]MBA4850565.1 response regulator transcription factor [Emticicia sp. BO119]